MSTFEKGLFIVLEGAEGTGKTTMAKALVSELRAQLGDTRPVVHLRCSDEPIRSLLVNRPADQAPDATYEALLFAADRLRAIDLVVKALQTQAIVICERFHVSTHVLQGHLRGLGSGLLSILASDARFLLEPDVTFCLEADLAVTKERLKGRVMDTMDQDFLDSGDAQALYRRYCTQGTGWGRDSQGDCMVVNTNPPELGGCELQETTRTLVDFILTHTPKSSFLGRHAWALRENAWSK